MRRRRAAQAPTGRRRLRDSARTPRKPVIALDADGVLVDFHHGDAGAWQRAFGARPAERDPLAYWPMERWHVERLEGEALRDFGRHFDERFWLSLAPLPGPRCATALNWPC